MSYIADDRVQQRCHIVVTKLPTLTLKRPGILEDLKYDLTLVYVYYIVIITSC